MILRDSFYLDIELVKKQENFYINMAFCAHTNRMMTAKKKQIIHIFYVYHLNTVHMYIYKN